jgi:hypothetical protein
MATIQEQIDALQNQLASGVSRVRHEGKEVQYITPEQALTVISHLKTQASSGSSTNNRVNFASFERE